MARRREPVVDVPARPARAMPAGMFKCQDCGRTLPVDRQSPGWPAAWACCTACAPLRYVQTPWKNPLGPAATEPRQFPAEREVTDGADRAGAGVVYAAGGTGAADRGESGVVPG